MSLAQQRDPRHSLSRRDFFKRFGAGLASIALVALDWRGVLAQGLAAHGPDSGWRKSTFGGYVGQSFTVYAAGGAKLTFKLAQVKAGQGMIFHGPRKKLTAAKGECYTLVFSGPRKPLLGQNSYMFEHRSLGQFSLFITPGKAAKDGQHYEAVINHAQA